MQRILVPEHHCLQANGPGYGQRLRVSGPLMWKGVAGLLLAVRSGQVR